MNVEYIILMDRAVDGKIQGAQINFKREFIPAPGTIVALDEDGLVEAEVVAVRTDPVTDFAQVELSCSYYLDERDVLDADGIRLFKQDLLMLVERGWNRIVQDPPLEPEVHTAKSQLKGKARLLKFRIPKG